MLLEIQEPLGQTCICGPLTTCADGLYTQTRTPFKAAKPQAVRGPASRTALVVEANKKVAKKTKVRLALVVVVVAWETPHRQRVR